MAGILLAFLLALAYGPAKLQGHSIYGGVIQDLTNIYGFFAWDEFTRSEILAGRFPLWNPHNAFGVPHLANMQTAVFYPLNWLKWLFGFWPVIDLLLMLRLWLAGLFTFLLARQVLKAGFWPAMLAATAFMLSGHLTRYVYMSHLNVEILLPLQLLLMHRLAEKVSAGRMIAAALGFALIILGGFPEASLYAITFSLIYYFFRSIIKSGRDTPVAQIGPTRMSGLPISAGLIALALGLIISSPQWLPFAEYYAQAWTYHDPSAGLRHKDLRLALGLILPWFFGENRLSPAVPFIPPYLGVIPVLLALSFLPGLRRTRVGVIFFFVSALALIGLIYGVPPFSFLGRVFPFSLTYNDKYAAPALGLSVSLLAAYGADRLREGRWKGLVLAAAVLLAWIADSVYMGYHNLFRPFWALGLLKPGLVVTAVALILAAAALAVLHSRKIISARQLSIGLFTACAIGLLGDFRGHTPDYHDDLARKISVLPKKLPPPEFDFRFHADPELSDYFPDRLLAVGRDDLRSYDPLYPKRYVEYLAAVNDLSGDSILAHYNANMLFVAAPDRVGDPLLSLARTGFYILPAPLDERLLVKDWAKRAQTLSPRRERWLRAVETVAGGEDQVSLLDHAPVRIEERVRLPGPSPSGRIIPGPPSLAFAIGVPDNQVTSAATRGDGVFFAMTGPDRSRLLFARYLDPKSRPGEKGFRPFTVGLIADDSRMRSSALLEAKVALSLLPGPKDDLKNDAAAWARLRQVGQPFPRNLKSIGQVGKEIFVYQDQQAFPRAWWARGRGSLPVGLEPGAGLRHLAETNLNIFHQLAITADEIKAPGQSDPQAKAEIKVAADVPGRIEIAGQMPPGFLLVSEEYFPGFRAFAENAGVQSEARIVPADGAFQAVVLPAAGATRLEVLYEPWSFRIGLWMAVSSLLTLLAPGTKRKK